MRRPLGRGCVKYLVLMAGDPGEWDRATEAERQAIFDAHRDFAAAVRARVTLLGGEALAGSESAVTVRPGGTDRLVTHGPLAATAEQLGGFYLVESPDRDTVVNLCRILPATYSVEVRPVIDLEGYQD